MVLTIGIPPNGHQTIHSYACWASLFDRLCLNITFGNTPNYSFLCPSKSHWNRPNWPKKNFAGNMPTSVMMNCLNTITF